MGHPSRLWGPKDSFWGAKMNEPKSLFPAQAEGRQGIPLFVEVAPHLALSLHEAFCYRRYSAVRLLSNGAEGKTVKHKLCGFAQSLSSCYGLFQCSFFREAGSMAGSAKATCKPSNPI